ncbi:MAG TPA: cation-translocating P-type ATPase [Cytophagaceae bacterium]
MSVSYHSQEKDVVISSLGSNEEGLSRKEAEKRKEIYGENSIEKGETESLWKIAGRQFTSPMVFLLIIAAGLSFAFQEWADGIAILIVILLNAVIGFYMEFQARKSMESLKKMVSLKAKVLRDGEVYEIPSLEVVPGDILLLEAGDMIMADARIISLKQLEVDEAVLTGESLPVTKCDNILPEDTTLAERNNMVYRGTYVTRGNAKAIVTATGMSTELGNIALLVKNAAPSTTPLEKKLTTFSQKLIYVTLFLVLVIFFTGLLQGKDLISMLSTSIALAVAAIPEGLPIVATLALANGMLKMAKHNVIVKKLAAVETLGGTNVICTDKTGTLTENKITASNAVFPGFDGDITASTNSHQINSENLNKIIEACILCNTAVIKKDGDSLTEIGDPLEVGLLHFASSYGYDINKKRKEQPIHSEIPFSSETKVMGSLHPSSNGYIVFAKGAVEEVISRSSRLLNNNEIVSLSDKDKQHWLAASEKLSGQGLKVLGFAYKETNEIEADFLNDLIFTGMLGLIDPPRHDVPAAIQECKNAGIKIIMITGDHPATARNIAERLGIFDSGESERVIHGKEMKEYAQLSEEEKTILTETRVFARVSPEQKLELVTLLQEKGNIVGMTGDGVNDSPALKKADIGIAMGERGTQVAQEVSDMVLKDDSFTSIVVAIREGRIIFENIKKFVTYLLSCNLSELFVVTLAFLLNLPYLLTPLQILFINLVTDVLPALALGVTSGNKQIMQRTPRDPGRAIITKNQWIAISTYSIVITVCVLLSVSSDKYFALLGVELNEMYHNNILFFTLMFSQLVHVFNMASSGAGFLNNEVIKNKYVWLAILATLAIIFLAYLIKPIREVLSIQLMEPEYWLLPFGFSFLSLIVIQLLKKLRVVR